ncbi:hypothetical protein J6590_025114 [Homalodisca vitripennis]|nr:hypothetical protein J6590_025114 [Homalodisca vitripennis]
MSSMMVYVQLMDSERVTDASTQFIFCLQEERKHLYRFESLHGTQWRSYLGWHPVRNLAVSPHPNMGRGIPHDSVPIIHGAELVLVKESPKKECLC